MLALETLPFSPVSHVICRLSSARFARHHESATIATALSPTFTIFLTPGMSGMPASSMLCTLPPKIGQARIAAYNMFG